LITFNNGRVVPPVYSHTMKGLLLRQATIDNPTVTIGPSAAHTLKKKIALL
jgi:hypothetical protein